MYVEGREALQRDLDNTRSKVWPCSFPLCSFTSLFWSVTRAQAGGSQLSPSPIMLAQLLLCIPLQGSRTWHEVCSPTGLCEHWWDSRLWSHTAWAGWMTHKSWDCALPESSKVSSDAASPLQGKVSLPKAALRSLEGGWGGGVNHSWVSTQ